MSPDLEKRVPREILEELIEEGTEAFRGILEKLFNVAMQLERSEFLGAEAYERTKSRRGYRNGFKGKRIRQSLADRPGPVQVLRREAPAQRHFTQADQVNQLVAASEADPTGASWRE